MRRLSLRVRLALGSSLLALVLLAVALLVTRGVVGGMLADIDASLARADLAPFAEQIGDGEGESLDEPAYGVLVRIVDPTGRAVVDTMPHALHEQVEHRDPADTVLRAEVDDVPYTIVGETLDTPGGTWALWAARSSQSTELALHGLDLVLVVGGAVLLALFGFASWLLARAALAPVERMRRAAAELPAEGDAVLPVGDARDELAQLASTLNDFLHRIRASTAREKQMVSDAAHELRTPVAALRTRLELARESGADAEALRGELEAAERDATRLGTLASNLLALTRLEQGSAGESSDAGELAAAVGDAVDRARLLAPDADIDLDLELPEGSCAPLGPASLGRVVDNLLANAIAATDGSGSIRVALRVSAGRVVLTVDDDGPGMPDDFLPRAFERFSRPDDARTRGAGGAGLGLALVSAIATAAGGEVAARNLGPGLRVEMVVRACENSHPEGAPLTPAP